MKPVWLVHLDVCHWCFLMLLKVSRSFCDSHCLSIESIKFLRALSCIWAWLLTRADNQIYPPESAGLHNAPHCRRPPHCLSPAAPLHPCSKANYTPQKHKSPCFKKSLFFRGLTLLGRKPGFLVHQLCEEFSVPAAFGT